MNPMQATNAIELRSPREVFSALAGTWELSRAIGEWKFRGNAVFCAHGPDELRYEENGILSRPGTPDISASRRYIYRYEAGRIAIYFDERPERLFQVLDPRPIQDGSWEAQAEHFCVPDHYASRYAFAPETMLITHIVHGPRKDYEMVTHYRLVSRDTALPETASHRPF